METLKSGSWINRNFDLWIGEATKNVAWLYMDSVSKDVKKRYEEQLKKIKGEKETAIFKNKFKIAYREVLITQGSDWYWWYGLPNESKNDEVFDYLFRQHLMNAYIIMDWEIPPYLTVPLVEVSNKTLRNPTDKITPSLICDIKDEKKEWQNAGYIFIPDGPTSNISSLIKNINFGCDDENLYFRFILNKNSLKIANNNIQNQIAIYFQNPNARYFAPIRFVNKNENIPPILFNQFSRELRFVFDNRNISRMFLNNACANGLWSQIVSKKSQIAYKNNVIELKMPLNDLGIFNKQFSFCIIDSTNELINEVYPQDTMISFEDGAV